VPLHEIYTAVRVVPRDFLSAFVHPDKMEEAFATAGRQQPSFRTGKVEDGIVVANREPFLNLLGAPGAGKSTFLRRLGQEALLARNPGERIDKKDEKLSSRYEHALLPVYLELRELRTKSVDLTARITDEFALARFPAEKAFVEAALANGKLLVLLDGLDEVPNEKLDEVIDHIRAFVDEHAQAGNRFVTSCRTAHYKHAFPRFTDMVVADFSDEQIARFANNWFSGFHDKQVGTAEKFIEVLKEPTNASARELARTPLLLTFLCLTYANGQELPPQRALLYRRALDLLLREWAASKRVHNEPIYAELNTDLELDMLAEFAAELFRENRFFFNRHQVTDHIRVFMSKELNAPKTLDAGKILEAIEVQQGLIVRRAQYTYSFSHLTIQEYLTAKKLWDEGELNWKQVVQGHLFESRWSVVFELLAGMGKSDNLLQAMADRGQQEFEGLCRFDGKMKAIVEWIARNANCAPTIPVPHVAATRLVLFVLALALALARTLELDRDRARARALTRIRTRVGALTRALDLVLELDLTLDRDHALALALDRSLAFDVLYGVETALSDARSRSLASARALIQELVKSCIRHQLLSNNVGTFTIAEIRLTDPTSSLEEICTALELPPVPETDATFDLLFVYQSGCELLVRCKNAAYRLEAETWNEVCETILQLPASS
jgi:hypothetical protein